MKRRPRRKRKAPSTSSSPPYAPHRSPRPPLIGLTILHEGAVYSDISAVAEPPRAAASTGRPCAHGTPTSPHG